MNDFSLTSQTDVDKLAIPPMGSAQDAFLVLCREESSNIFPSLPSIISEPTKQIAYADFLRTLSQSGDNIARHTGKKLGDIFNEIIYGEVHLLNPISFSTVNSLNDANNLYEFIKGSKGKFISLFNKYSQSVETIDGQVNINSRGSFLYYISLDLVGLVVQYLENAQSFDNEESFDNRVMAII